MKKELEIALNSLKEACGAVVSVIEKLESDRFVKNSDGSVLDKSTGLTWAPTLDKEMTFADAEKACKELTLGGHKDWRLPTVKELISLVDYDTRDPAIDKRFFPDIKSSWYWSGSPLAGGSGSAWVVGFNGGNVGYGNKGIASCVRPVRSSQ